MYQGYPDFQNMFVCDDTQWIAAYKTEGCYYRSPDLYAKLVEEPLDFSLNITRSQTAEIIYGTLDFQAKLQYPPICSLINFNKLHKNANILALPIKPYKLNFSGPIKYPSSLTETHYSAAWYSAQSIQFTLLLDSDSTQLIEKTLLDDIVGFSARINGLIEGVSPRLPYEVTCDPLVLVQNLSQNIEDSKQTDNSFVFPYKILIDYLAKHLSTLCPAISPQPANNEPDDDRLIAQTLVDRLYNHYGSPHCGVASSNILYIALTPPKGNSRLIINLQEVSLTQRPFVALLDPFTAAQQIAKVSPDTIIHKTTAPALPDNKKSIDVFYSLPQGLSEGITIDIQLDLAAGILYPSTQSKTEILNPSKSQQTFVFINNHPSKTSDFTYQLRVNYPTEDGRYKSIVGEKRLYQGEALVLDRDAYPCEFFSLNITPLFAQTSQIKGNYKTADIDVTFTLNSSKETFNYPVLDAAPVARITAYELTSSAQVKLQRPIVESTQIGADSFPEFGSHQAQISVDFRDGSNSKCVQFQSQSSEQISQHVFTPSQPHFNYQWNVTSIYQPGFRYRYENTPWSDYVTDSQTITLETVQ